MISLKYIREHDLVFNSSFPMNYDVTWMSKFKDLVNESDIVFKFSCQVTDIERNSILEFSEKLPFNGKILVFEECTEKGGGGDGLPNLSEIVHWGLIAKILSPAAAFVFRELAKETYIKVIDKFFDTRKKNNLGKFGITLNLNNGSEVTYSFNKHLTKSDCTNALRSLFIHYEKIKKNKKLLNPKYLWDKKSSSWVEE